MPDLSELDALQDRVGRFRRCLVGRALKELEGDDLEVLRAAIADYSSGVLVGFLERRGFEVSVTQATAHRRGKCVCFKA